MRRLLKIIVVITIFLVFFFIALVSLTATVGKNLVIKKIESFIHRKTSISSVFYSFPLVFKINDIQIQDLFCAKSIIVSPHFLSLFAPKKYLNRLTFLNPHLIYRRTTVSGPSAINPAFLKQPFFLVKNFIIKEGSIDFIDYIISKEGVEVFVDNLNFEVLITWGINSADFKMDGKISCRGKSKPADVMIISWLDWGKREMHARIGINNLDALYFYPYYSQRVSLENTNVEKALVDFKSDIYGINNKVTVDSTIEFTEVVFRKRREGDEPSKEEQTLVFVLDAFKALDEGKVFLEFSFGTTMDRPEIKLASLKKAFEDKINRGIKMKFGNTKDLIELPGKLIGGAVKKAVGISKTLMFGTVEFGQDAGRTIMDTFIKVEPVGRKPNSEK